MAVTVPRVNFLYFFNQTDTPSLVIKVTGNQWFWSYSYLDFDLQVDSYLTPNQDLKLGDLKLLLTDSPCVLPTNQNVLFLLTRRDVLHSWAIPSLLLKRDVVPGITTSLTLKTEYPGCYLGFCSEVCGAYHSFIPIHLEVTSLEGFKTWLKRQL